MRDTNLLDDLLAAENEGQVLEALNKRKLLDDAQLSKYWRFIGDMRNNEAVILAQQSSATAALIEKFTNGVDAILLRLCKAKGLDPRGADAPRTMADAIDAFFGDLDAKTQDAIRALADTNLVLYATGSKSRPSLSLYDAGEGQLAKDFPQTFCSLISAGDRGSYKGSVPFVQGRFNMGGTGVLQFCSKERKLQLIVSRVPPEIAGAASHEWAYTLMCYFPGKQGQDPAWRYLVGDDGEVRTAGHAPMALLPRAVVPKAKEALRPRERKVSSGTLIKMYDYEAPQSNVCGELFKKVEQYLLRPALPLRIVECRREYAANVMAVTVWDCMARWAKQGKLEEDFREGASFKLTLTNGETVDGEIRVFKMSGEDDEDAPHTGVRALINGQSHGKRDARFFRSHAVDREHIAGSILVTLFCERLSQATKNHLFMSNRETLREGPTLNDLLDKLQVELRDHEALKYLNNRRYEEKVKSAVKDADGLKALEELLQTDPTLANLFGSLLPGIVAAPTANGAETTVEGDPKPFKGKDFPSFFHRGAEKHQVATVEIPKGDVARVSFNTDVKNNYFTRRRPPRGTVVFSGTLPAPSYRLFNGRLTFTCRVDKTAAVGDEFGTTVTITDKRGSGPFTLTIDAKVAAPREKRKNSPEPRPKPKRRVPSGPSQPDIEEQDLGPGQPPAKIEKHPATSRLKIVINKTSGLLRDALKLRSKAEAPAVEFVFKYGLALAVMGLLDSMKDTDEWKQDEVGCRENVEKMATGIARVIVPLCLSLPKNLPKPKTRTKTKRAA
jgi:hypothetical protein